MKTRILLAMVLAVSLLAGTASAGSMGWIDTDRFGYSGTITRYSDADLTQQVGDVILTGPRDLALFVYDPYAIVMGSWWYTTSANGGGWGNTSGNTGPGFMQYYDVSQNYVTSQSYGFSNFDGTHWTDFHFSLLVNMTEAGAYSRLSAPTNTGDGGYFQTLALNLTATGLKGVQDSGWIIAEESDGYATGVTGKISGVFVNTSTSTANNGYYVFSFDMSIDNWAYDNRDDLVGSQFAVGSFGAPIVPEPATMTLLGLGLGGLALSRVRRRKAA